MRLLKPSKKLVRDFSISFWAGLVASVAIVFSFEQQNNLITWKLALWIIALYFLGLFITANFDPESNK